MKILISEDDPSFRRLLEEKLAKWGYDVVVAENGDAALQILQSEAPPRLAMLDWMIPVTISFGVAASSKERMKAADSLVKAADEALYRAKENGRNRVEVAC